MNKDVQTIQKIAKELGEVRIMEVCGGHTNTIMKYGIRELLPKNIKLISGPGCPVCVTSQRDIDSVIELALGGVKVAVYGDMVQVPGSKMSLRDARSRGADVKTLYSVDQMRDDKDRMFFAVGFETTTPMTARLLELGVPVFCAHKIIPPAMNVLATEMNLDGFIDPGHVSTVIGSDVWKEVNLHVPQVISGFQPEALIRATRILLEAIRDGKNEVINDYPEVVFPKGNALAQKRIQRVMKVVDAEWRGMGVISKSGLAPRNKNLDARIIYADRLKDIKSKENPGCRCGEIVRGLIEPRQCKLFGKKCTPENPQGACMVSDSEGACAIAYKYGKSLSE